MIHFESNVTPHLNIAIVSVGGIFPGAADLEAFWANILAGRSVAREAPANRWLLSPEDAFAQGTSPDHVISKRACFIEHFQFDANQFDVSDQQRRLLEQLDPMFHLQLHAGKQAWDGSVTAKINRARTGIIIGNIALPTDASSAIADEILGPAFEAALRQRLGKSISASPRRHTHPLNRYVAGLPAGVLARVLNLGGGTYTLDAACASSLYAIKLACDELTSGRADAMLAGGLSRPDSLYTQMGFSQLKALSPTGRCAPFDANANGLVVGEGCGMFVLKRLEDARRDDDRIHAVIRGIGLSNDIGGNLMLPDSEGQLRAMRAAYAQAGWSPSDVDLIECHGTGTPTGDAVELHSMRELRSGSARSVVVGSVKSNVGHLLTGAGAAGLMKVLFAMRDGVLPPTANFGQLAHRDGDAHGGIEVLRESRAWARRDVNAPRRAAISAFGFGGINAHVLVEEWREESAKARAMTKVTGDPARPQAAVAIVGMDVRVGPWETVESFLDGAVKGNRNEATTKPTSWWNVGKALEFQGHFIDEVAVPIGRFAIPPAELRDMLPQQLLMLSTAANAMADAKLDAKETQRVRMGVFVGIGLDLNTTNFHFRWSMLEKARAWAAQAGLDASDDEVETWASELRDAAGPPLTANRTMGALGGIVASRVARAFHIGGPSFTVSAEEASGLKALEVAVRTLQRGEIDSAIVGAVDLAGDLRAAITERASRGGGANSSEPPVSDGAAAVILKRYDDAIRDGDKIYAVIRGIGGATAGMDADETTRTNAVHRSIHAAVDDAGIDARTIGLIETAGATDAQRASENDAIKRFMSEHERALPCAVADIGAEVGRCGAAASLVALVRAVLCLHHDILPENPRFWLRDRVDGPRHAMVGAMSVDGNAAHVIFEEAEKAAGRGLSNREMGKICAKPQAAKALGKIAFVYPGAGNQFLGMARELSVRWPQVLRKQDAENQRLGSQFARGRFWSAATLREISHRDVIFGQVCVGTIVTDLLARIGVKPDAVIGYSLGETTSLFSTRLWSAEQCRDEMLRRMDASPLFTSDLTGPCDAAKIAWKLGENEKVDWLIGVLRVDRAKVEAAIAGRARVYLLIVNSPGECVVGGDRAAVLKLAVDLRCALHPVEGVTTVHCEVLEPMREKYRELHLLNVEQGADGATPRAAVYSSAWGKAYDVTRESAADSIMAQASGMVDFTRVVEAAYADGVRIFVETGPGESCTRMIREILGDREHLALAVCVAGEDEVAQMLEVLSKLREAGVVLGLKEEASAPLLKMDDGRAAVRVKVGAEKFDLQKVRVPSWLNRPATKCAADRSANGEREVVEIATSFRGNDQCLQQSVDSRPAMIAAMPQLPAAWSPLVEQMAVTQVAQASAQEAFLRVAQNTTGAMAELMRFQAELMRIGGGVEVGDFSAKPQAAGSVAFDRAMCLEFAVGSIGRMLGPQFAPIDAHSTRVRLPDEPLMLCDRILEVEGEPGSMTRGRCVTEHDIHPGAWYLDCGRIPTCIAVEAGQADLFLSGYLGIDFITKGNAVYRLLDAVVTFHGPLPHEGQIIRYDIRVNEFFRQGETYLFRFEFDATVDGRPVLTMRKGCAGFFTEAELVAGQGIVLTSIDKRVLPGVTTGEWRWLSGRRQETGDRRQVSEAELSREIESYSDAQIDALRRNDARSLVACFGEAFAGLPLQSPVGLPGGGDGPAGRMKLVHRVLRLDAKGGRFGLGQIVGEADIHADDWFLTCHFVDDRVMPGTLMYECCLHTLRVLLLRMGWVGEQGEVVYEPIPEVPGQLKCRGQVNETTKKVQYEITVKEIGYGRGQDTDSTPYVIADALMYADGRAVVQMNNMSLRLTGLTREKLEAMWDGRHEGEEKRESEKAKKREIRVAEFEIRNPKSEISSTRNSELETRNFSSARPAIFDFASIYAFAAGNPSEAFGDRYKIFDHERKIARLPRPPYQFLDRIVSIENCEQWKLAAGGVIEAEYDVPADAWYFASNRQGEMPFAVLLEAALQPCGWLAAYLGSALTSDTDLRFRNLGGSATQFLPVTPTTGTLTTTIKITRVSQSGGMIIQNYDMSVRSAAGEVYRGDTYFGFFSADALRDQVGIRDAKLHQASAEEINRSLPAFDYPDVAPFPDSTMRMVDRIDIFDPQGGPRGLGFIQGTTRVNPAAWFFEAHFYQDPVVPGSLGLESFIQLLKVVAANRWGGEKFRVPSSEFRVDGIEGTREAGSMPSTRNPELGTRNSFETPALGTKHTWVYRGQIIPTDEVVTVQAVVTEIDDVRRWIKADGFLSVDGRTIYQMKDFTIRMPDATESSR